jgi:hypothetical protein
MTMQFLLPIVLAVAPALATAALLGLASRRWSVTWRGGLLVYITGAAVIALAMFGIPHVRPDWQGGTALRFRVQDSGDETAPANSLRADRPAMLEAVQQRLRNVAGGAAEVRFVSDERLEVLVPGNEADAQMARALLRATGKLDFRILANEKDHAQLIELAGQLDAARADVLDPDGKELGRWVRVPREVQANGRGPLRIDISTAVARDATSHEPIVVDDAFREDPHLERSGPEEVEVLVYTGDGIHLGGDHLASISAGFDEMLQPCINFRMSSLGGEMLQRLSSSNLPDAQTGHARQLGIILDDHLLTAPRIMSTISDRGQITGRFTREEVDMLVSVLRAGRFPHELAPVPVSISTIPPADILGLSPQVAAGGSLGVCLVLGFALAIGFRPAGWLGLFAEGLHLLLILAFYSVADAGISAAEICLLPVLLLLSLALGLPMLSAANASTGRTQSPILGKPAVGVRHAIPAILGHTVLLLTGLALPAGGVDTVGRILAVSSATGLICGVGGLRLLLGLVRDARRPVMAQLARAK